MIESSPPKGVVTSEDTINSLSTEFGVEAVDLQNILGAFGPFERLYRNPNGVLSFYRPSMEVIQTTSGRVFTFETIGFWDAQGIGECRKISLKFADYLKKEEPGLLMPFTNNGMSLAFAMDCKAPYYFPENHAVLLLYYQDYGAAIALDPSLGLIDRASFTTLTPYQLLSEPGTDFGNASFEERVTYPLKKDGNYSITHKRIILGLSTRGLPILYEMGMYSTSGYNMPVIFARQPDGDKDKMFILTGRTEYINADELVLTPEENSIVEEEVLGFAEIYYNPPEKPRVQKPRVHKPKVNRR